MRSFLLPLLLALPWLPQDSRPVRRFITGEVLDPAGKAAPGATARLWRFSGETLPSAFHQTETRLTEIAAVPVDAEGRFKLPVEDGRFYTVSADHGVEERAPPESCVPAGVRLVLRLLKPVTLQGRVLRKEATESVAVAGAEVEVRWSSDFTTVGPAQRWKQPLPEPVKTTTDGEGRFSVRVPGLGASERFNLSARASVAGTDWSATKRGTGEGEHELLLAAPTPPDENAPKPTTVQFVDKAGKPVPGVRIMGPGISPALQSDAEGRVKLVQNTSPHAVPAGHARTAVPYSQDPGGELKLELEPGLNCSLRLLRGDGAPLADTVVLLGGPVRRENTTWHHMQWTERTDAEGRLTLHCLQSGMTIFGFAEVDGVYVSILHATPKKDLELGDVRVTLNGRLTGRIVGPDGAPVPDVRLLLQTPGSGEEFEHMSWPSRQARSNAVGAFTISALVPGKYRMAVVAVGLKPLFQDVVVTAETAPLQFVLERGESIRGKVLLADGKPAANASISTWSSTHNPDAIRFGVQPSATADERGSFLLGGLPQDGAININVHVRSGDQWQSGQRQGVETGTQDLEIQLTGR